MRLELDTERSIHGLKTALACLIGFYITQVVQHNINQWITITIVVVMCAQINVGGVIQKSYMRFLGTVAGSALSLFTLYVFGNDSTAIAGAICVAAILFGYLATGTSAFNEAGTLGAATVIIILLSPHPTLLLAFERFMEISIGILIAAIISLFVLPVHARYILRMNQAKTIRELREFYLSTLHADRSEHAISNYQQLDEKIVQSFLAQRKLANDAGKEIFGKKFNLEHFQQILICEKEILRSISFMHYAFESASNRRNLFSPIYTLQEFHDAVCEALLQIASYLEQPKAKKITISLPSIKILKESVNQNIKNISLEEAEYPHAYLFCAEVLIKQLKKLAVLFGEIKQIKN